MKTLASLIVILLFGFLKPASAYEWRYPENSAPCQREAETALQSSSYSISGHRPWVEIHYVSPDRDDILGYSLSFAVKQCKHGWIQVDAAADCSVKEVSAALGHCQRSTSDDDTPACPAGQHWDASMNMCMSN